MPVLDRFNLERPSHRVSSRRASAILIMVGREGVGMFHTIIRQFMGAAAYSALLISGCAFGPGPEPAWGKATLVYGDAQLDRERRRPTALLVLAGDGGTCRGPTGAKNGCLSFADDPVTRSIHDDLGKTESGLLVWLGDNVYPAGLVPPRHRKRAEQELVLARQLDAANGKRTAFVAGNHDWAQRPGSRRGWRRISDQDSFLSEHGGSDLVFGRDIQTRDVGRRIRVVLYDSEWQIGTDAEHEHWLAELEAQLLAAQEAGRLVVLASHHPLVSVGEHARSRRRRVGFLAHNAIKADMLDPRYRRWRAALSGALDRWSQPESGLSGVVLALAAGHEHSLQVVQTRQTTQLVSGSSEKLDKVYTVKPPSRVRYAGSEHGYLRVSEDATGEIAVEVIAVTQTPSTGCEHVTADWFRCRRAGLVLAPAASDTERGGG